MSSLQAHYKANYLSRVSSFLSSKTDLPPSYSEAPPKPLSEKQMALRNCYLAISALHVSPLAHPTFLLAWAIQNPLANTNRLRHFLYVYLAREHCVEPPPVLNDEDTEYFCRLGTFLSAWLAAYPKIFLLDYRGKPSVGDCRKYLFDNPVAALDVFNYAGQPYPSAQESRTRHYEVEKLRCRILAMIVAFAKSSGEQENGNTGSRFPMLDGGIAWGDYEYVINMLDTDRALLERVFPYGEAAAKGQAVAGVEGARALYFEGVDEEIVRREMNGRPGRVRSKGWRLTGYSRGLLPRGGWH